MEYPAEVDRIQRLAGKGQTQSQMKTDPTAFSVIVECLAVAAKKRTGCTIQTGCEKLIDPIASLVAEEYPAATDKKT